MNSNPLSIIGFDDKDYQIYSYMLSVGNTSIQDIAQHTGIKRPTVYLYAESLIQRGHVVRVKSGKKTLLKAVQISSVENRAENAYKKYRAALPELARISSHAVGKPVIEILEGEQGVLRAYEDMSAARTFRIWSDLGKVEKKFSNHFSIIANQIKTGEITTREILSGSKETIKASKHFSVLAGNTYTAKIATVEGVMNDSIIYGDTVVLFRIHDSNMYAVRIKDETIASTLSALFDMAWKNSISIKDYLAS